MKRKPNTPTREQELTAWYAARRLERLHQIQPYVPPTLDGDRCPNCGWRDSSSVAWWASCEQTYCEQCGQWFTPAAMVQVQQQLF
jgi:uncharacterized OB-fold protein